MVVMFTVVFLCLLYCDIRKIRLIRWEDAPRSNQDYIKEKENKINFWLKAIITPIFVCLFLYVFPCWMDFPALINGDYISVTGKVLTYEIQHRDEPSEKIIKIVDEETEQCLKLDVYDCPDIDVEDVVTVKYLRYSKKGIFAEKVGLDGNDAKE
jgi:hypothetical protein